MSDTRGEIGRALAVMRGRRVVLLGDCVLDAYLYGETVRVSREAPVLVVKKERVEYRLGGAANVAANLTALGVRTEILSRVGRDAAGEQLRSRLEGLGVDVSGLQGADAVTPQKTRILAGAFGTTRQQVLRIDDEPNELGRRGDADELVAALERRAGSADAVVISDYGLGLVTKEVVEIAESLGRSGRRVCVDSRYGLQSVRGVTVVKPNVPEAQALVGYPLVDRAARDRAGEEIIKMLDCEACLLTQGKGGMTLYQRQLPPAHVDIVGEEEVTDVTGAGDTVTAALSAALGAGLGLVNAMRLANCAAGIVVMKAGAATASPAEIQRVAEESRLELEPWAG